MEMTTEDRKALMRAFAILEHPSLAARIADKVGQPVEWGMDRLPGKWRGEVDRAVRTSLNKALDAATRTMDPREMGPARNSAHKWAAVAAGGVGGFFGVSALVAELPVTTTIILRSIADIAREMGEDLSDVQTRLACLSVFALGGESEADDGTETGYYFVRAALARQIGDAARTIAGKGAAGKSSNAVMRLISAIAARFGVVVGEKTAAQLVPVVGALGGAAVNAVFIDHFQDMARGHFTIRRLERQYGADAVRAEYEKLKTG